MNRGPVRARSVAYAAPLSRGGADGARRPTLGIWPRFSRYVVARRYARLRHRTKPISASDPSNGAEHFLPFKVTVKGAPTARRRSAPQTLEQ